ncbi:MAG: 2,3-bisphosphoglycerate-independent phosphoglycerate mutase [Alphaproteobacteria bacterium]
MKIRPVVLCILDGWGWREDRRDNAIAAAHTPVFDRLWATAPHALLRTSGADVGLPEGQMGNSEVGHMNIGAGRIVMQELPRIDTAIADGELAGNSALQDLIAALKKSGGACHLMGLLSPGGVHSHQRHMAALAREVAGAGVPVRVHAFLDGRDTPPRSARQFMADFLHQTAGADIRVVTVSGRYYAMDRDGNWNRIAKAHDAMSAGDAAYRAETAEQAIEEAYARGETDEFVSPAVIGAYDGVAGGDGLLMTNFRADRAREILTALLSPEFDEFPRRQTIRFAAAAGMTFYSPELGRHLTTLFPPQDLDGTLGEVVAEAGLTQFRIAETEKYAHVTYFLNGGREAPFPGEERILVPSPKVATYDLQPEMSARAVTEALTAAIQSKKFDLVVVNFANPDMVGHTGIMDAAIRAVETVDTCLGRVEQAAKAAGGVVIVTADHGNVELMQDPETGSPHTAHTAGPVPVLLANAEALGAQVRLHDGRLADLAPTVLHLLGLERSGAMSGDSLINGWGMERRETA